MLTDAFIGQQFERPEGTLVLVEDAETFDTFIATGVLSRSLATEAPDGAPVVVILESDQIDFLGAEEPEPFVTFLQRRWASRV
jgi:hypothetical protein